MTNYTATGLVPHLLGDRAGAVAGIESGLGELWPICVMRTGPGCTGGPQPLGRRGCAWAIVGP